MAAAIRKCLECKHVLRDPSADPSQIILAQNHLCVADPPTTFPLPTAQGIAMLTIYPQVTKDTLSCSRFACETKEGQS